MKNPFKKLFSEPQPEPEPQPVLEIVNEPAPQLPQDDLYAKITGNDIDYYRIVLYDGSKKLHSRCGYVYNLQSAEKVGQQMIETERKRRRTQTEKIIR